MIIKDVLKEAERYDEILNIIVNIASGDESSFPVNAYKSGENTKWRVDGALVRKEAIELLQLIFKNEPNTDVENDDRFFNLLQYVETESDTLLHNYAVSISHRREPYIDMEIVRCWNILVNLLYNYYENTWDIPTGWKRIKD